MNSRVFLRMEWESDGIKHIHECEAIDHNDHCAVMGCHIAECSVMMPRSRSVLAHAIEMLDGSTNYGQKEGKLWLALQKAATAYLEYWAEQDEEQ